MQAGVLLSGVLVGVETKPAKDDKPSRTVAMIAVGMDAYRVTIKPEEVLAVGGLGLYEPCIIAARPFCSSGKLYWTDGAIVSGNGG